MRSGNGFDTRKMFFALFGGLLVIAVIAAVIILVAPSENAPHTDEPESSDTDVPSGSILVNDIYEGRTLIPKFDYPENEYFTGKFKEEEGRIIYDSPEAQVGIDVSEYQLDIDWQKVKASGVDFAMLRLGYRGHTKGLLNMDSNFEKNYENASAVGIELGVYFYSQATSAEEAVEEAEFVLKALGDKNPCYPIVFDWERPVPSKSIPAEELRAYYCTGDEVTSYAKAFCERIKKDGRTPMIYMNKSMAYNFYDLSQISDYDMWYAEYQKAPSLYYDFRIWQYSETGTVPGVPGSVDMNICFKSY